MRPGMQTARVFDAAKAGIARQGHSSSCGPLSSPPQSGEYAVKEHEFTVILAGISEITDEAANALFEAGCDDGSPGSCDGVVSVDFHRDAATLEAAIQSAVADVRKAGFQVERVEIYPDSTALTAKAS
jgi:hypothetical protein